MYILPFQVVNVETQALLSVDIQTKIRRQQKLFPRSLLARQYGYTSTSSYLSDTNFEKDAEIVQYTTRGQNNQVDGSISSLSPKKLRSSIAESLRHTRKDDLPTSIQDHAHNDDLEEYEKVEENTDIQEIEKQNKVQVQVEDQGQCKIQAHKQEKKTGQYNKASYRHDQFFQDSHEQHHDGDVDDGRTNKCDRNDTQDNIQKILHKAYPIFKHFVLKAKVVDSKKVSTMMYI